MRSNEEMIAAATEAVRRAQKRKQRTVRGLSIALAAALLVGVPTGVLARRRALSFSEIAERMRQRAEQAVDDEAVAALREQIAASDGMFSKPTDPPDTEILLDEDAAAPVGRHDISGEYDFCLERLTPGKTVRWRTVSGSVANGDAEVKRVIEDDVYAIVSIARTDGAALTDRDRRLDFCINYLIDGYVPEDTTACFIGEPVLQRDDGQKLYYAVAITNMLIFARHGFALAFLENTEEMTENSIGKLSPENFYADRDGNYAFRGWALERVHALLPFTADESYADPAAEKLYVREHCINRNFRRYK